MRKIFVLFSLLNGMSVLAQSSIQEQKNQLSHKINDLLIEARRDGKVYTPNGAFNKIYNYNIEGCNLTFWTYGGPVRSESTNGSGANVITIDFSQIGYIEAGKTNYGYDCYIFTAEEGSSNVIKVKDIPPYIYGFPQEETTSEVKNVTLPGNNEELRKAFNQYAVLCRED